MNKATYLFIRNLGAYWADHEDSMMLTFRELIRRVELADEKMIFDSAEDMSTMEHDLFGRDFIHLLSKVECRLKRDARLAGREI